MSIPPHLLQAVRESRMAITREYSGLLSELDIPKRFRDSVKTHPMRWMGGAIVTGLMTSLVGIGGKAAKAKLTPASSLAKSTLSTVALSKIGWGAALLEIGKLLYPIVQPIVMDFASKAVKTGIAKKSRPH